MCEQFKIPVTPRNRNPNKKLFDERMQSDSEDSVRFSNSDNISPACTQSSNGAISLAAEFDDLMQYYRPLRSSNIKTEKAFLDFVNQVKPLYEQFFQAIDECQRLQNLLDDKIHQCSDFEHKLSTARKLLDHEKQATRTAKKERDELASQIQLVQEYLFKNKTCNTLSADEIRQKLSFLYTSNPLSESDTNSNIGYHSQQLSAIKKINSTDSILSDFSYSRSEDDLNNSILTGMWKKHRPSTGGVPEPAAKKRRSSENKAVEIGVSDTVRATTTLTVSKGGPITATSMIKSVPPKTPGCAVPSAPSSETCVNMPAANLVFESWTRRSSATSERRIHREHCFHQKILVMPETCGPCGKRIRFGKIAIRCKECKIVCHVECKDNLPVSCIPILNTRNGRNILGVIGDYTPITSPMVPALLIHCINEIELRGLTEIGLYRMSGSELEVKALKDKFLRRKGTPCLNKTDVHVICGTVKDFLRSLHETIVPYGLWKKFVRATEVKSLIDLQPALYQVISELPQPNRDTLAYMILHLQKVSEAKDCKMNVSNLAKVFGPTIVGYSCDDPSPGNLLHETVKQIKVMEELLKLPTDYWSSFINVERSTQPAKLQQTPSTDSLLRSNAVGHFSPIGNRTLSKKRPRYFASPKNMR